MSTVLDPVIAQVIAEHNAPIRRNGQHDVINETAPRELHYFSAGESLDPMPPIEWTVDGVARAGAISSITGGPKIGKSLACAHMGVKVALGKDWQGKKVKQCPVVYLDEENGEILMRKRIAMILHGLGVTDRDIPFYVLPIPRLNLGAASDRDLFTNFILDRRAGLVIWDSFIDVLTLAGAKESISEDQMRVLLPMQTMAVNTGAAFIVIHHENRSGTYRGSSALPGAVETMVSVKGKPGEGRLEFEVELSRSATPHKFSAQAEFSADGLSYTLNPVTTIDDTMPHFSKSEEFVLRYLQQHGASKIGDIMANADTCSDKAARNAVYSLAHLGRVSRVDTGKRGEEATYGLTGLNLNEL
jgi:hypothetical protein